VSDHEPKYSETQEADIIQWHLVPNVDQSYRCKEDVIGSYEPGKIMSPKAQIVYKYV
jgi:hypothetical protein